MKRGVVIFGGVIATIVILGVTVFPTRSLLTQSRQKNQAEERLDSLQERNEKLEQRARALENPSEIERLAREQYNLVRPGEEAYALLPPTDSATTTTQPG